MHELGLVQSIIEKILNVTKNNNLNKVYEVEVSIGDNSGVSEEEFKFCFSILIDKIDVLKNAKLKIIKTKSNLVGLESIVGE